MFCHPYVWMILNDWTLHKILQFRAGNTDNTPSQHSAFKLNKANAPTQRTNKDLVSCRSFWPLFDLRQVQVLCGDAGVAITALAQKPCIPRFRRNGLFASQGKWETCFYWKLARATNPHGAAVTSAEWAVFLEVNKNIRTFRKSGRACHHAHHFIFQHIHPIESLEYPILLR